ncbi:MAG: homospermidine synthase [Bauldia sp.]|uniref:homospermidine synthase n=1 Tax=Bauldia sp. TaxID=2575872 RepID=UPI001D2AD1C0|nr:homospermidine synthase [Bauldia sp.]MCB1497685.1 homospermidine synthase [Bauldia sp.]
MAGWPIHGKIDGPIVMIGFGSIGRGMLPLIERHFEYDASRMVVIDPEDAGRHLLDERDIRFVQEELTPANFREILTPLLTEGEGTGFCVNLSVDTSSLEILRLCREIGVPYIDTVVEPWPGFYFDRTTVAEARTNNALRNTVRQEKAANPGGTTAVSCCGANPGMVSWFVKQALVNIANDTGHAFDEPGPDDREGWARLMRDLGVKGVHIAERDTQRARDPKPMNVFVNTWSVEGFISEGLQPAELGWGTHEKWMPDNAHPETIGPKAGLYLLQPGADTRVRTWCPTPGAQHGFLVTHNESISIADFFTLREGDDVVFRPTCHYAYHPADDAVLSLHEMFGQAGKAQDKVHILDENEIVDGIDELGVLLYGHARNAYWFGSQLSIEETRDLAPYQNATGLQVTSAVLAGMVWALENPDAGIVETDEMDYRRCLEVQVPYLGPVKGYYTDWTPLSDRPGFFPEDIDENDPWQFRNVLVR